MEHTTVIHECRECGHKMQVHLYPSSPATHNSPPEPATFEPTECEECNQEVDDRDIDDLALELYHSDLAAQEAHWDEILHRRREGD